MSKTGKKSRQKTLEARRRQNRRRGKALRAAAEGDALAPALPPKAPQEEPVSDGMLPEEEKTPASGGRRGRKEERPEEARKKWAWRSKPWVWYPLFLLGPAIILFCCQLATLQSAAEVFAWMGGCFGAAAFTYALLLALVVLLLALTRSLFFSTLLVGAPALVLSLASHFKEVANGVPLLVSDLAMAARAGDIAGFMRPGMDLGEGTWWSVGVLAALLLVIALFGHRTRAQGWGWYGRTVSGLLAVLVLLGSANFAPAAAFLSGPGDEIQAQRNDRLGLLAGIYSGILDSAVQEPDAYNENNMNAILVEARHAAEQSAPTAADSVRPNVILLMSESFCDPEAVLPGVDFIDDPIPNYRALAEEWPSGQFLSNTYAGGTGNVEMEVMTGVPIAFVGEDEDLTSLKDGSSYERIPSIVKAFAGAGYATEFVHSYTDRLYNRADNLPAIGFEKVLFEADFPENADRAGPYLSDMALTDMLISEFEGRDKEKPLLLFGLSMENHQPYFEGKFPEPSGLRFESDELNEEQLGSVDALLYGLHGADEALGVLLDYFETCGEPVMVVFWGDHLPGLSMDADSTIYSILGYSSTADTKAWSPEELKRMHTTRFLVWNNYGADPEIPGTVSTLELGSGILDWAGVEKPLYFHWVDAALTDMLLYRQRLFVAGDGTPYYAPPEGTAAQERADTYRTLVYDILYGEGYIAREMTRVEP